MLMRLNARSRGGTIESLIGWIFPACSGRCFICRIPQDSKGAVLKSPCLTMFSSSLETSHFQGKVSRTRLSVLVFMADWCPTPASRRTDILHALVGYLDQAPAVRLTAHEADERERDLCLPPCCCASQICQQYLAWLVWMRARELRPNLSKAFHVNLEMLREFYITLLF